jgi:hypothetical protein
VGGGADNAGVGACGGVVECKDKGEGETNRLLFVGSLLRIELIDDLRASLEAPNSGVREGVRNFG